ncbi:TonB-dependent receptor [Novosphingobium sp. PS1R-30]|uniref:TonB-dependent receptor n=1 Tax=Novosphingobium anseongense TaxID=3133436 RepID=A0ABU8RYF2_9SPHN
MFPASAYADEAVAAKDAQSETESSQAQKPAAQNFSTGVAKGRDMLDSAISASAYDNVEIQKIGARSLSEVLRNIPGIRAEAVTGEGNASYTIRGLPLAATGSKFVQFQEDGLPVLEFGDLQVFSPDSLLRADLNLARIETIRGGSASTFGSNSPGGVINLMTKTGEVEGGSIRLSTGVDYGEYRVDAAYGGRLTDTVRFQFGGFYRKGEGPRDVGYDAYKGGQFKFNVTKEFDNGYIRLHLKYLDDKVPFYQTVPIRATGTDADPSFVNYGSIDVRKDSLFSQNIGGFQTLDQTNRPTQGNLHDGIHSVVKSIGLESQFDVGEWTVTERFRFADISGSLNYNIPIVVGPAAGLLPSFGGPGARLSYASGPNRGQAITNPSTLNGNGLVALSVLNSSKANSYDNMTNDLRISRVWNLGGGKLTTTAGFYKASQDIDTFNSLQTLVSDARGGGETSLLNITTATGVAVTQDGVLNYNIPGSTVRNRRIDANYDVNAPYGSINYHTGRLAVGGSVRYDIGRVKGTLYGADLGGGRVGITAVDVNGDGVISLPERTTSVLPLGSPAPLNYKYDYLSYSVGVNYRVAESFAVFGRYSRGGRAAADRIPFTAAVNSVTGALASPADGYDTVKQAELGAKFRKDNITLNATAFYAKTSERNQQIAAAPDGSLVQVRIARGYKAKGVEIEGTYRTGGFSLAANATFTDAEIESDPANPLLVGNKPRHASSVIFSATPQYETELFTVGFNAVGTTSNYAQDTNQLKLPGYTLINAFARVRPMDRVELSINASNLFNKAAFVEVSQATIPAGGLVLARTLLGRTISAAVQFDF